jgi:putative ABC transport system permease protein
VVEGEAPATPGHENECDYTAVSSDYFRTLGIRVVEGRSLTPQDDSRAIRVAVIGRTLAAKHFPNGNAIGKRLSLPDMGGGWLQIVGVVEPVRTWGPDGELHPEIYVPILQNPSAYLSLAVRAQGDTRQVMVNLRTAVRRVDADLPLAKLRTMEDVVSETALPRRLSVKLLTSLAAIALSLAALGIFGMLNRNVIRGTREIGIRMALGATRESVVSFFVSSGLRLVSLGLVLGLVAAFLLAPLLSNLVFEIKPRDPLSFLIVPAVFVSVAFLSCLVPSLRATKVDPMVALRYE